MAGATVQPAVDALFGPSADAVDSPGCRRGMSGMREAAPAVLCHLCRALAVWRHGWGFCGLRSL